MPKTIIVAGYGQGISHAVAQRFGREGFQVALVARSQERLDAGVKQLAEAGVTARPFPCDLGDPTAVAKTVESVHSTLGPVTVVHYNAYSSAAGDLLTASVDEVAQVIKVCVLGLISLVQTTLADLETQKGSVLVTGGGFSSYDAEVNVMGVQWGAMGLSIGKAAQRKTTGLLRAQLAPRGVHVGDVLVLGTVRGTAFDGGGATLEPSAVADQFWDLWSTRSESAVAR